LKKTAEKMYGKIHKEFAEIKPAVFLACFYTDFQAPTIVHSQSGNCLKYAIGLTCFYSHGQKQAVAY